jgi:putative glutamine amidotransferase
VVAVLSCGRDVAGRRCHAVAERFLTPIARVGGSALIVPAMPAAVDAAAVALRCDALLMTGSCSDVDGPLYGGPREENVDHGRDEVALAVASAMIEACRPVLGICRGMQELNVLFGGSLVDVSADRLHMEADDWHDPRVFEHRHEVSLVPGGRLSTLCADDAVSIFSAHRRGVGRIGSGLRVEALAPDGLVEAFSARPGAGVLGVQWHPELRGCPLDEEMFADLVRAA